MADINLGDLLAWEQDLCPATPPTDADLEREVGWAVVARASAPMLPTLRGGELVVLPRRVVLQSPSPPAALLQNVAERPVAAVIHDRDLRVEAPSTLGPVRLVPRYGDVSPEIDVELNQRLTERRGELYRMGTEVGRLLSGLTAAGAGLAAILTATAEVVGFPVQVEDRFGRRLVAAGPAALAPSAASIRSPIGSGPDARSTVRWTLPSGEAIVLGPVGPDRRALARLVAERIAVSVEHALPGAEQRRPRGVARATMLADLLASSERLDHGEAARRATMLGLRVDGTFVVVRAGAGVGAGDLRQLAAWGRVHEVAGAGGETAAIVELPERSGAASAPSQVGSFRLDADAARDQDPSRGDDRWLAASEPVSGVNALPEAGDQASYLAALLRDRLVPGPIARFDDVERLGAYRLLYALRDRPELERFVERVLGRVVAQDRRGELRKTLLAFLEAGGSHVDAAARLAIHRNTLGYRLRRIAALGGFDPADPAVRLTLHLALLAAAMPPSLRSASAPASGAGTDASSG